MIISNSGNIFTNKCTSKIGRNVLHVFSHSQRRKRKTRVSFEYSYKKNKLSKELPVVKQYRISSMWFSFNFLFWSRFLKNPHAILLYLYGPRIKRTESEFAVKKLFNKLSHRKIYPFSDSMIHTNNHFYIDKTVI